MAGGVWWKGVWQGGVHGRWAHVWQGVICVVEWCAWQGHVWQGACMAGGMHGRGHVWQGHAWQGVCIAGGHVW